MFDVDKYKAPDRKYAPIQILHDFQFVALNVREDYSVLQTLSEDGKVAHIEERLRNLAECGYGGVVLNVDFENYLKDVSAFQRLDKAIDIAKDLGLRVWLYDEQYYPSGSAGGLVLQGHPELEGQGLACVSKRVTGTGVAIRIPSPTGYSELKYAFAVPVCDGVLNFEHKVDVSSCRDVAGGLCWDCKEGEWNVYCFFVRVLYEWTYLTASYRASRRYPNIVDKRAMQRFLDITYEKYEKYLKAPLGERIEAVFTDEPSILCYRTWPNNCERNSETQYPSISIYDKPNPEIPFYPYIPWAEGIEQDFLEQYGYNIVTALPEIFEEGPGTRKHRENFYLLLDKCVWEAYIGLFHEYTASQNMKLSGHYYREEKFDLHPFMYGDILNHLGGMDTPGCDLLYSSMEHLRHSIACKIAASAAHIYGKPHVMIEASNMADEDQSCSLEKLQAALSTMYIHGIDTITSYYAEQILPFEEKRKFVEYGARLGAILDGGKNRVNTLLYYPYRQLCANCLPAGSHQEAPVMDSFGVGEVAKLLMQKQICFDLINDVKLSECRAKNGFVVTGYGERIERMVFPKIDYIDTALGEFVCKAVENGVQIVFYGPERNIQGLDVEPLFIEEPEQLRMLQTNADVVLRGDCTNILMSHRTFDDYELYMLMNTEEENVKFNMSVPIELATLKGIDPVTMQKIDFDISVVESHASFEVRLNGLQCLIIYTEAV